MKKDKHESMLIATHSELQMTHQWVVGFHACLCEGGGSGRGAWGREGVLYDTLFDDGSYSVIDCLKC